jgi:Tfp pilus assembly protein PilO
MKGDFTFRKNAILAGVTLLVLADVALGVWSSELASDPEAPAKLFEQQRKQHDLLKADIRRAQEIRDAIPANQAKFDQIEGSFPPASTGYSAVRTELGDIGKKAGIQMEDLSFKPTEVPTRGMTEVAMDATVNGNYASVIRFLNGVQRSGNYEVESLTLAADSSNQGGSGVLKVAFHLKTYFRTSA